MASLSVRIPVILFIVAGLTSIYIEVSHASESQYTQYVDSEGRFRFEYPTTMTVQRHGPDYVSVFHPKASLRISVFIENRQSKSTVQVKPFLDALKNQLVKEHALVKVLEEGHLPGPKNRQGYLICYYIDKKGSKYVQLVQYYVTKRRILQMVISDRPKGFKNLQAVIRKIHHSLRVNEQKLN